MVQPYNCTDTEKISFFFLLRRTHNALKISEVFCCYYNTCALHKRYLSWQLLPLLQDKVQAKELPFWLCIGDSERVPYGAWLNLSERPLCSVSSVIKVSIKSSISYFLWLCLAKTSYLIPAAIKINWHLYGVSQIG